jgi:hypothetical protein
MEFSENPAHVILSEAKDLLFADDESRFLAALGMTKEIICAPS